MVKKTICWLAILVLITVLGGAFAETEENVLSLAATPAAGDREILLILRDGSTTKEANVFSGEEAILEKADLNGQTITLFLTRELRAGEELTILMDIEAENAEPLRMDIQVESLFKSKLATLCGRADEAWQIWAEQWAALFTEGKVYMPALWKEIPFALWADEAPEILVKESEEKVKVYLQNEDLTGWRVCLAAGIPTEYTECGYDEATDAWIGEGAYDAVCLIRDMNENAPGITIEYRKENGFLPSYPVMEWQGEKNGKIVAMNCYGWGTTRSFDGGMYAIGSEDSVFYAEYDAEGAMMDYQDAITECAYNSRDQLISGEEPEGYVNPVFH